MEYNIYFFSPGVFLLAIIQFNRNRGLIKECLINQKYFPKHYVKLKWWERKWFKLDVHYLPKFMYISFYLLWVIIILDLLTPLIGVFFTISGLYDFFTTFRRFEVHIILAIFIIEKAIVLFLAYIYKNT